MSSSPNNARSLFAAAREDGPTVDEREAMFRRVALTTGIAGSAAVAAVAQPAASGPTAAIASSAKAAGAGVASGVATKLLVIGAAIGVVSTALGVLLAVTLVTPEARPTRVSGSTPKGSVVANGDGVAEDLSARTARPHAVTAGATLASPAARTRDPSDGTAAREAEATEKAEAARVNAKAEASARAPSDLDEEARLVTAARTALMAGDAARALALVVATRKLGARALEPEELGLEARALRALGRADDAAATELVLRRRYPESALAR